MYKRGVAHILTAILRASRMIVNVLPGTSPPALPDLGQEAKFLLRFRTGPVGGVRTLVQ